VSAPMLRQAVSFAVGLALVTCCGLIPRASAQGSGLPKTLSKLCGLPGVSADVVQFASADGARVTGAVGGKGGIGVVLANSSDGTMCDWVGNESKFINLLIGKGYRVLLFNYKGAHWDANVVGAAAQLRAMGARRVVLVGASTGGIVALGASARIRPAPVAVIGLSASGDPGATSTSAAKGGIDGKAAAAALKVPLLLVTARNDSYGYAPTVTLFRAAHEKDKQLLVVPGQAHAFFDFDPSGTKVDARALAFIGAHT
jgi:pimeloyl-ACP methyl ester carboxylesterase